jgi:hypothetical protein
MTIKPLKKVLFCISQKVGGHFMLSKLRVVQVVLLGMLVSSLCSCAFGNRHVTLNYPPEKQSESAVAEAAPVPVNGKSIILMQFVDQRSNKSVIGEVRNGWGMRTADVVVENDVSSWLTNAVRLELEKLGYKVTLGSNSDLSSNIVLGGEVLHVYCTAMMTYEGEVSFFAMLQKDGKELLRKRYTGKGSAGLNWSAASTSYGSSLSEALSIAIKDLVVDVNNTIKEKNL